MLTVGVLVFLGAAAMAQTISNTCATVTPDRTVPQDQFGTSGFGGHTGSWFEPFTDGVVTIESGTSAYGSKTCPRTYVVEYSYAPCRGAVSFGLVGATSAGGYAAIRTQAECERLVVTGRMWSYTGKWMPTGGEVRQGAGTWDASSNTCAPRALAFPQAPATDRFRLALRAETLAADAPQTSTLAPVKVWVSMIPPATVVTGAGAWPDVGSSLEIAPPTR